MEWRGPENEEDELYYHSNKVEDNSQLLLHSEESKVVFHFGIIYKGPRVCESMAFANAKCLHGSRGPQMFCLQNPSLVMSGKERKEQRGTCLTSRSLTRAHAGA